MRRLSILLAVLVLLAPRPSGAQRAPAPRAYDTLPDWSGAWSMVGGTVFDRATQTG